MRHFSAALAATATVLTFALAGCGDDEKSAADNAQASASAIISSANSAVQSGLSAIPSITADVGEAIDEGKLVAWVTIYRGGYPDLAQGRSDDDIKGIVIATCKDISAGKSESEATAALVERAKNGDTAVSDAEAPGLYAVVAAYC